MSGLAAATNHGCALLAAHQTRPFTLLHPEHNVGETGLKVPSFCLWIGIALRRFNAQTQVPLPQPMLATREFHYAQPARRHLQLSHRIAGIELAEPMEASVVDGIDIAAGRQAIASGTVAVRIPPQPEGAYMWSPTAV